jgi:hypothetical protein
MTPTPPTALVALALLMSCGSDPCGDGYGRNDDGACLPLADTDTVTGTTGMNAAQFGSF